MQLKAVLRVEERSRSFAHAIRGLREVVSSQANARLHLMATLMVGAAGLSCGLDRFEWCFIVVAVASVWTAEALNTALEHACDATCPEQHPLIGRAKDAAAGAVLVTAAGAALVGVLILGPHLAEAATAWHLAAGR